MLFLQPNSNISLQHMHLSHSTAIILLFKSRINDTGLMALPVLAKAWMMWFCMMQIIQKPVWWPSEERRKSDLILFSSSEQNSTNSNNNLD